MLNEHFAASEPSSMYYSNSFSLINTQIVTLLTLEFSLITSKETYSSTVRIRLFVNKSQKLVPLMLSTIMKPSYGHTNIRNNEVIFIYCAAYHDQRVRM